MGDNYYQPCVELTQCHELDKYWESKQLKQWFDGYLKIAKKTSYALAECQVGYAYLEGIGVEKDLKQAFFWTNRSAKHGDRDGQFNLAWIYENGIGIECDLEKAKFWYQKAAKQNHDLAVTKCQEFGLES